MTQNWQNSAKVNQENLQTLEPQSTVPSNRQPRLSFNGMAASLFSHYCFFLPLSDLFHNISVTFTRIHKSYTAVPIKNNFRKNNIYLFEHDWEKQ